MKFEEKKIHIQMIQQYVFENVDIILTMSKDNTSISKNVYLQINK